MEVKIIQNGFIQKILYTKYFLVTKSFIFLLIIGDKKYTITVPAGFITDLGSIPPVFFMFDKAKYISYILHDFLYSLIGTIKNIDGELKYDREMADEILFHGLRTEGMNIIGRVLVNGGLYVGGEYNYKKRNLEISKLKTQGKNKF